MSNVNLKDISLFDVAKDYTEDDIIGDYRHPKWQRFMMIAVSLLIRNKDYRIFALELSNMVKTNSINGDVLSSIIDDMSSREISSEDEKALKIVAAINNM